VEVKSALFILPPKQVDPEVDAIEGDFAEADEVTE
jgi:hypothetical protein